MVSVTDTIALMLSFGGFVVGLIQLVIAIVQVISENKKKGRH